MTSPCPNCSKQSKCGCKSCVERNGFDAETETFDETGELIICPHCKVASHPDHWLDAEMKQIREIESKRISIDTLKPFNKPLFSDFLKEQLEFSKITIEDFSKNIGLDVMNTQILLRDGLVIRDETYSYLDKFFGMSNGFYKRLSSKCYWTFFEDD